MKQTTCRCLYCEAVTGRYLSREAGERKTVCGNCSLAKHRDEASEVAAGLRPWARPLSFWVGFFGQKALPAAEAAEAQARWDAGQARIGESNDSQRARGAA